MGLKVVHIVHGLHIGGLERVLINCINALPLHYEHFIICLTSHSEEFSALLPARVKIIDLNKHSGKDFSLYVRCFNYFRAVNPDVVHTYNLATFEYQFIAFLCGVKKRIHAEHGRDIYDPEGKNRKYRLLRKVCSWFVHKIVSVSGELDSWLRDDLKLDDKKLILIRNGIDTEYFVPANTKPDTFILGHVGRLSPIKNQKLLIDAFVKAREIDKAFAESAKVIIVGDGECMEELTSAVNDSGLQTSVEFCGSQLQVREFYQQFSVFVMTSIAEGIPMTLLEAMSCGVPAIATDVGGMGEVITNTEGELYRSRDVTALGRLMVSFWKDREKTDLRGHAARKRIEESFSEKVMVNAYQALYEG